MIICGIILLNSLPGVNLGPLRSRGKCAVVIGGTSGLGKAVALGIAEAGADVVAASRRQQETNQRRNQALGRRSLRATVDVRDRSSIELLQRQVLDRFGKVDILVNAAGITFKTPTLECSKRLGLGCRIST